MNKQCIVILSILFFLTIPDGRTAWETVALDTMADAGRYSSIRVDSNNQPHIAYYHEEGPGMKYAYLESGDWQFEPVSDTTGQGYNCALVLDHNDSPMIAHYDDVNADLILTYMAGNDWRSTILDEEGYTGQYPSIARDSARQTIISYFKPQNKSVNVVVVGQTGWVISMIEHNVDSSCTALAIDSNDRPHIAYSDYTHETLRVAYNNGSTWILSTVDGGITVSGCDMEVDSENNEHIMFIDSSTAHLFYAYRQASSWNVQTIVENASASTQSISYEMDSTGKHHVCFYDMDRHLSYVWNEGSVWHREVVDTDGKVGISCSMDLDEQNLVHISYFDLERKDVKYARQLPSPTPTPPQHEITYDLVMNDTYYTADENFLLERSWMNTTAGSAPVDEYIILDIQGFYWFWPGWGDDLDYSTWTAHVGGPFTDTILTFTWPDVAGEFEGIRFWGAFLEAGTMNMMVYDMVEWGYGETTPGLILSSSAFANGGSIPSKYTCDGSDISPPLAWNKPSQEIQSFALIMDDPDAPSGTWTHWIVYRIPAGTLSLPEDIPDGMTLPDGSYHGINSWGDAGYGGPCPPSGTHRYFFTLYALDIMPTLPEGATKTELLAAINGHILYQAELMATYMRTM